MSRRTPQALRSGRAIALLVAAVLAVCAAPVVADDNYPSRSVKIIAPQAPGGGVDLVARIIAERLGAAMHQAFIVENQSGAGGAIARAAGGVPVERWEGLTRP